MNQPRKPDKESLENIFPARRIPQVKIGGCSPELRDYIRDFGDRTWQEVSDDAYCFNQDAYCLMDFKTLIHFIAGFMRYSLSTDDAWNLIYFACSERFCEFCQLLDQEQRDFVIAFVDHYICDELWYSDEQRKGYQENRAKIERRRTKAATVPAGGGGDGSGGTPPTGS